MNNSYRRALVNGLISDECNAKLKHLLEEYFLSAIYILNANTCQLKSKSLHSKDSVSVPWFDAE